MTLLYALFVAGKWLNHFATSKIYKFIHNHLCNIESFLSKDNTSAAKDFLVGISLAILLLTCLYLFSEPHHKNRITLPLPLHIIL